MAMLPGTKVLAGKNVEMEIQNPVTTGGWNALHIDKIEYTPEVDSATYASSATSGYKYNTSGVLGAAGSFDVLLDSGGVLAGSAGSGLGFGVDDIIGIKVYSTNNHASANLSGNIHIKSIGKPLQISNNKIMVSVKFDFDGPWTEA